MKTFFIILAILILLIVLIWLGLQIQPRPFAAYVAPTQDLQTVPLPDDLPAPVDLFYRQLYGDSIPLIESAVISGTGRLRINGITLPARFRFTHISGQDYRHYIETTIYGLPFLKVNEHFLNGKARLELPFGISEGPKIDQGANLALWAEVIWMPCVWVNDPRVHWEALDDSSATLVVPFLDSQERFTVTFDAQTGLLKTMQSQRYKAADSTTKTLWINEVVDWQPIDDQLQPIQSTVTWQDEGTPWAHFITLEVVYNSDVGTTIQNSGVEY